MNCCFARFARCAAIKSLQACLHMNVCVPIQLNINFFPTRNKRELVQTDHTVRNELAFSLSLSIDNLVIPAPITFYRNTSKNEANLLSALPSTSQNKHIRSDCGCFSHRTITQPVTSALRQMHRLCFSQCHHLA